MACRWELILMRVCAVVGGLPGLVGGVVDWSGLDVDEIDGTQIDGTQIDGSEIG